jgi:hypothetical protein
VPVAAAGTVRPAMRPGVPTAAGASGVLQTLAGISWYRRNWRLAGPATVLDAGALAAAVAIVPLVLAVAAGVAAARHPRRARGLALLVAAGRAPRCRWRACRPDG